MKKSKGHHAIQDNPTGSGYTSTTLSYTTGSSLHHQRSLSKIPNSILKTPVPPTIVLPINHHTMEWTTCRGCLSINSRCLQDQPTTALHYMYIDVFNCTYSSFGCCFPLGMRCQSATIRQRRFAEYWKKKKRTSYIRWDDDVMVSTLYQTNTHSIWFYPAMTAFTDQYSLPNIFFNIGQL